MKNRSRLLDQIRFIQIETGTVCNYKCIYCPVAFHNRTGSFMPISLVKKIASELHHFPNLKQIYLNGYDEPTLNPQLAEVVQLLIHLEAKITLLTNGTLLTPQLVHDLDATGADIEFDIHLAAVNFQDFQKAHQSKMFKKVMNNIEYLISYAKTGRIEVHISMQGKETEIDNRIFQEMKRRFADTNFKIHKWFPNDRAGLLKNEFHQKLYHKMLKGCSLQNRTQEWMHINANGKAILCCQDYFEEHIIGDANIQSLVEIASSDSRARYNEWTMGESEAPEEYICRKCMFAISE